MSNTLSSPEPSSSSTPLRADWIDRIFEVLHRRYGVKFADQWRDLDPADLKLAWAEDLAGHTGDEIKRGLDGCRTRIFPPTLPEFMLMCRPRADARADWVEACEQMPLRLRGNGDDRWSRPEVYWAAVAIGNHDLQTQSWDQVRPRWERALAVARAAPIPAYHAALPSPGKQSVSRDEAKRRIGEVVARINHEFSTDVIRTGKEWAHDLMHKEAACEGVPFVAQRFWREALGVPLGVDAAEVLRTLKAAA